ncbi:nucleoside phosphorylase domain-containing protein [Melampsora americana]|nr:nucleoside phosphorylase domain-containing protein [Melampsora americana]
MKETIQFDAYQSTDSRLIKSYQSIKSQLPIQTSSPKIAIVCGSGLNNLSSNLTNSINLKYQDIDQWPKLNSLSIVKGHESKGLTFGKLGSVDVVCQTGRGYPLLDVIFAVRIFKLLGCEAVILTNAAGAVNPNLKVGQIIALYDHLALPSLTSWNPLIGPNIDTLGPRFPPMSDAYDFELRKSVFRSIPEIGLKKGDVTEGIYAWVAGPTYETRAEGRFIRSTGADVVGMSTVPEVIAARHVNLRVLTLSLVTNVVIDTPYKSAEEFVENQINSSSKESDPKLEPVWKEETANHDEVLEIGELKSIDILKIVKYVVNDSRWKSSSS